MYCHSSKILLLFVKVTGDRAFCRRSIVILATETNPAPRVLRLGPHCY